MQAEHEKTSSAEQPRTARQDKFRNVVMSMILHPEYYEPITNYKPLMELFKVAHAIVPASWRVIQAGVWFQAQPPLSTLPFQGWKIHVSATPANAEEILARVARVCVDQNVAFKFACDKNMLALMNSKSWDRGGSGKFMTIYPDGPERFLALIERLYRELKGFEGPYILSDRRYKDCKVLYYRFGGIAGLTELQPDGNLLPVLVTPEGGSVPDDRSPYYQLPEWVRDPFPEDEEETQDTTLFQGRFILTGALNFTNTGGVYTAIDSETGRKVVIKEARPHTGTDVRGHDAVSLLEKEWRLLNKLQDTGIVPQPIARFWEWEHLFIVESFVEGQTAQAYAASHNTILRANYTYSGFNEYVQNITRISINLAQCLGTLHSKGIIFGDVSPNNIMINPADLSVCLIDLEGAYEQGVDEPIFMFTPGFSHKDRISRRSTPTVADDYYSLGSVLMCFFMPVVALLDIKPHAHLRFLEAFQRDFGLPDAMVRTIQDLMDDSEAARPSPAKVVERLAGAALTKVTPQEETVSSERIQDLVHRISAYILHTADPKRHDRLFPADSTMVNPLGIAHGALGVAYALQKLTGEVPASVMQWIFSRGRPDGRMTPGLYAGLSGIAWAFAELGYPERARDAMQVAAKHPLLYQAADVYHGLAGYGMANLRLWRQLGDHAFLDAGVQAADWLVETRHENDRGCFWTGPGGEVKVGYAHGASGISVFLLYMYLATGDDRYVKVGRKALDYDLSYGQVYDNCLSFPDRVGSNILMPYWTYGTAGVATAVLRYAHVTRSEELTSLLADFLPDIGRKYTLFPGLFLGLAGLGNCLLDIHQYTGSHQFKQAAARVIDGLLLFQIPKETGIAFPGDNLYRISTDFGTGSAGIALFLNRFVRGGSNFDLMPDELMIPLTQLVTATGSVT